MNKYDVLKKVKQRIADPNHWTKGDIAVNSENEVVTAVDENACKWCVMGALDYVTFKNGLSRNEKFQILNFIQMILSENVLFHSVTTFNDAYDTIHADVLDLLDQSIIRSK